MGVETDTNQVKIGDGVTPWVTLPYAPAIPESVVTNLIADLAAKGALVHTHAEADITALVGDLATKETPAGATVKDIAVIGAHKVDPAAHIGTYALSRRTTAIIFGTSIEAQCGGGEDLSTGSDNSIASNGRGWVDYLNGYLGQRFHIIRNAGVGGNTYADMLARVSTDVLAYTSDWVLMGGPVNDIANGRTTAAIQADTLSILALLAPRTVLMLTAAPSVNYNTTPIRTVLAEVNAWIRKLPETRANLYVADAWKAVADPATGSPATSMAVDGIHWSSHGALRVGLEAYRAIGPFVPLRPHPLYGLLDPAKSVIANPHFGTNGAGWATVNAGFTVAYSADDDTMGNKATLTLAGVADTADRRVQYVENISGGRFAPGDTIQGIARFRWSGVVPLPSSAGRYSPVLQIMQRHVDNSFGAESDALSMASSYNQTIPAVPILPASGDMVIVTPRVLLDATVDRLYCGAGWMGAASGEVIVSEVGFFKV